MWSEARFAVYVYYRVLTYRSPLWNAEKRFISRDGSDHDSAVSLDRSGDRKTTCFIRLIINHVISCGLVIGHVMTYKSNDKHISKLAYQILKTYQVTELSAAYLPPQIIFKSQLFCSFKLLSSQSTVTMANQKLYTYPSPLAGYENAPPLPRLVPASSGHRVGFDFRRLTYTFDYSSQDPNENYPPVVGLSPAYKKFPDPIDNTAHPGGFDAHIYFDQVCAPLMSPAAV